MSIDFDKTLRESFSSDNDSAADAAPQTDSSDSSAAAKPAFEYQPPKVEVPPQPTVSQNPYQQPTQFGYAYHQQPSQQAGSQQSYTAFQPSAQQPNPQQGQAAQQSYMPQNPYQQQSGSAGYYQYAPNASAVAVARGTTDGFAIASLILSIVGLIACCTMVPSVLATVFAIISKTKNDGTRPTGVSTAGLVLGIIGILWNLLWISAMINS